MVQNCRSGDCKRTEKRNALGQTEAEFLAEERRDGNNLITDYTLVETTVQMEGDNIKDQNLFVGKAFGGDFHFSTSYKAQI